MKAVVKQLFMDKNVPGKKYFPGDVVDFDAERVEDLVKKGLVEKGKTLKESSSQVQERASEDKRQEKSISEE